MAGTREGAEPGTEVLASVEDYRRAARELLPRPLWDALMGDHGAPEWATNTNNVEGFRATRLRPRVLVDIARRSLRTTVLGTEISLPVMIAPTGGHQRYHVEGELATVRSAGRAETIMLNGTSATYSIEEVAEAATGPLWFQLYFMSNKRVTEQLVRRAEAAGYRAIALTVDNVGVPLRERDLRFSREGGAAYDLGAEHLVAPTYDPGRALRNFQDMGIEGFEGLSRRNWHRHYEPGLTWRHVEWLRAHTTLPLVIKGVQTGEDARLCVEHGVEGIIVSNHGGFALRNARSTIEQLPEVVAHAGAVEVYLDGGVREGTDVLKALGLGARAVCVGRAQTWGLAVGGEDGSTAVLEILRGELDDAMRCCGVVDVTDLPEGLAIAPPGAGVGDLVDRLERLASLHERGLLSREEFERAKSRCLG